MWDPSPLGSSLLRHLSITHQRQVPMIKPTPLHDRSDISAQRCQSVSWSYSCSCPALWQTHSYRAISLCRRFQKSQNRCRSSGTPRWPRSPSSNWSPSCPGASEPETEQKKNKMNKTEADFYLIWNKSTKKNYNFILLLCVVGRRPLPLGRCRDFGLGPAGRALTRRTSCFRDKKKKKFVNRGFFFTFATEKTRKSQFIFKILTNGFCFKL